MKSNMLGRLRTLFGFSGTALACVLGCSDDVDRRESYFEHVHEISKIELDAAQRFHLSAVFRVGALTASGSDTVRFEYIHQLAVDTAGMLYVFDLGPHVIRVIRPDGTFSHDIGETNSGPKSLGSARAITVAGDTVIVLSSTGLTFFRNDGELLATKRWAVSGTGLIRARADTIYMLLLRRGQQNPRSEDW